MNIYYFPKTEFENKINQPDYEHDIGICKHNIIVDMAMPSS